MGAQLLGYRPEWFVGVRVAQTQKFVAFIACTPALLYRHGTRVQPSQPEAKEDEATSRTTEIVVEVNFLCVHKKLRSAPVPVLIKEITRRVNVCGIFQARARACVSSARPRARPPPPRPPTRLFAQAAYTAGIAAAGALPVATLAQPQEADRGRAASGAADDDDAHRQAVRAARAVDARAAADGRRRLRGGVRQLNKHLMKYVIAPQLSEAEFANWLLLRTDVIYSFVSSNSRRTRSPTWCRSTAAVVRLGNEKHTQLRAAYCYYVFYNGTKLLDPMQDALILKTHHFDVFNALGILDNGLPQGACPASATPPPAYNWRANVKLNQVGPVLL